MIQINIVIMSHGIVLNHWVSSLWAEHLPYTRHCLSVKIRLTLYSQGKLCSSGREGQNRIEKHNSREQQVVWRSLKGIRKYHPKIYLSGMLITLNWRQLRSSGFRKSSMPSLCQEEERILVTGDRELTSRWVCTNRSYWNNPYIPLVSTICFLFTSPQFNTLSSNPLFLCLATFPQVITLC